MSDTLVVTKIRPGNRQKVTVRLPMELVEVTHEAVRLGIAESSSAFIEEAVRQRTREVRYARMRHQAQEAMNDQDFVADMRETMQIFQHADALSEEREVL